MTDRRPIPARDTKWAARAAKRLADAGVQPNQISIASILFAAAGSGCLLLSREQAAEPRAVLLVGAAVSILFRLLCNMFDGMVAVEFGRRTQSGAVYNELPDRLADSMLFVSAGYAVSEFDWVSSIGWAAALLAALTAYVRTLGASLGLSHDFSGPMAKQQRMTVLAAACVIAPLDRLLLPRDYVLTGALLIIAVGSALTVCLRTWRLIHNLESQ